MDPEAGAVELPLTEGNVFDAESNEVLDEVGVEDDKVLLL